MPRYVAGKDEVPALAAQDAAEALIALGWPVLPHGPDIDLWQIGGLFFMDNELIGLATRRGIRSASERVQ